MCLLAWCCLLLGSAAVAQGTALHFRDVSRLGTAIPGLAVLDADERQFLAQPPELRVGPPAVPSRPFEVVQPDGTFSGIQADMLAALAKALGLRIRPVQLPDWPATLRA